MKSLSLIGKNRDFMRRPWRAFNNIENEFNHLLEGFRPLEEYSGYDFMPNCNVSENSKEYHIRCDLPGIKKDDVNIEIENGRLLVRGERKENIEEKDEKYYLSESFYGSFMRSFTLPSAINEARVEAKFDDGVLTITVPKSMESMPKPVKIA